MIKNFFCLGWIISGNVSGALGGLGELKSQLCPAQPSISEPLSFVAKAAGGAPHGEFVHCGIVGTFQVFGSVVPLLANGHCADTDYKKICNDSFSQNRTF